MYFKIAFSKISLNRFQKSFIEIQYDTENKIYYFLKLNFHFQERLRKEALKRKAEMQVTFKTYKTSK